MSEQQDIVTPLESASNVSSNRKTRPGKAQRAAMRSNISSVSQASSQTGTASVHPQSQFARRANFDPVPQPGKFPVVFPTGAGEPTRDAFMAINGCTLDKCFSQFPVNYIGSAKYAEFSANAEYTDTAFSKDLVVSSLLGVTQQIVHAHQNIGLPIGDFSAVSSTDIFNPVAVRAVIHQFGEFAIESLGTRYLYKSYEDEVNALVRTATRVGDQTTQAQVSTVLKQHWLPTHVGDRRTAFIVATRLSQYLKDTYGFTIEVEHLSDSIFVQPPTVWNTVKGTLSQNERERLEVLFQPFTDKADFFNKFTANGNYVSNILGLTPPTQVSSIVFGIVSKIKFPELATPWIRRKPTITKFFSCGTGLAEKAVAKGSPVQLAEVESVAGITVVKSLVAVSAPEFSLLACFPPTSVYPGVAARNVVLTTSIVPSVRAAEFIQLDWL